MHRIPPALAIVMLLTLATRSSAAEVDIRDDKGDVVIIGADAIKSYDWSTHTLTLTPAMRPRLADSLRERGSLVSGVPFAVCVDGKPIYDGTFTTSVSSFSFATPVIVVNPLARNTAMLHDNVRIQLGYPTEQFFKGEDPRGDKRIEEALRDAGKLTSSRDKQNTEWIAGILKEIQTLKPGMTREDLLKIFTEEGGLSNRFQRRYAHRACPYIKVNVKFDWHDPEANSIKEHPQDKITHISTPFLEWTIAD